MSTPAARHNMVGGLLCCRSCFIYTIASSENIPKVWRSRNSITEQRQENAPAKIYKSKEPKQPTPGTPPPTQPLRRRRHISSPREANRAIQHPKRYGSDDVVPRRRGVPQHDKPHHHSVVVRVVENLEVVTAHLQHGTARHCTGQYNAAQHSSA